MLAKLRVLKGARIFLASYTTVRFTQVTLLRGVNWNLISCGRLE